VPDVQVTAKNVRTQVISAAAISDARGYFRSPGLPPGEYQLCVSGGGYLSTCEDQTVVVNSPVTVLNRIIPIRVASDAIVGTVTLADHRTPCFWFRPFNAQALLAKISGVDPTGQIVVGPVNGNVAGQYVLPKPSGIDALKLRGECDGGIVETMIPMRPGTVPQDLVLASSVPRIMSLEFSKDHATITRADPGDLIRVVVTANDSDGSDLHYKWTDDSGRELNLPDAPIVEWRLLNASALNTLHVQVSNGKGGFVAVSRSILTGPNGRSFGLRSHPDVAAGNPVPTPEPPFLGPVFGSTTDNSAVYQAATDAQPGGTRDTLDRWKTANGFNPNGDLASGEAMAIYFNNGDLKFGRDMHCRVTNTSTGATACYVSNFGRAGADDATTALTWATQYETSHQTTPSPTATVAMEYDRVAGVQFWAYGSDGKYLPKPTLDSQGPKPMPDICMACHQGHYSGHTGDKVQGAAFLPFDLDSFLDVNNTPLPMSAAVTPAVQEQFRLLNNMVIGTHPPNGIQQLVELWYPGGPSSPYARFVFNQGAAQLSGAPFARHENLYDSVVKVACRSCHVAIRGAEWNMFSQMNSNASFIQSLSCGPGRMMMPHAEVPWLRFWQEGLNSTLSAELNFSGGCPASHLASDGGRP